MFLCWIINLAFAASSFFSVKFCARVVELQVGYFFVERKAEAEKCLKNWLRYSYDLYNFRNGTYWSPQAPFLHYIGR